MLYDTVLAFLITLLAMIPVLVIIVAFTTRNMNKTPKSVIRIVKEDLTCSNQQKQL